MCSLKLKTQSILRKSCWNVPRLTPGVGSPLHCKIQTLRIASHWQVSSSRGCDGARPWLECWTYCRAQRWGQDHLVQDPMYDIPPGHQPYEHHGTFSESHPRDLESNRNNRLKSICNWFSRDNQTQFIYFIGIHLCKNTKPSNFTLLL